MNGEVNESFCGCRWYKMITGVEDFEYIKTSNYVALSI